MCASEGSCNAKLILSDAQLSIKRKIPWKFHLNPTSRLGGVADIWFWWWTNGHSSFKKFIDHPWSHFLQHSYLIDFHSIVLYGFTPIKKVKIRTNSNNNLICFHNPMQIKRPICQKYPFTLSVPKEWRFYTISPKANIETIRLNFKADWRIFFIKI